MITTLLATLALADPYGGFRCRLHPFGQESLYLWSADMLEERGYDLTSLLYEHRARLIDILGLAREPAVFNSRNVNLIVRDKKRTWIVDATGTVQFGKSSLRLDKDQFQALQDEIQIAVPRLERDDAPRPRGGG